MRELFPAKILELHPDPLREEMARLDRLEERFRTLAQKIASARPVPSSVTAEQFWRSLARDLVIEQLDRWGDGDGATYVATVLEALDGCAASRDASGFAELVDLAETLANCRALASALPGGTAP
jgi:hypothetical protein